MSDLRVLVADGSAEYMDAVRWALAASEKLTLVGEAADGRQAVAEAQRARPDVALLDMHLPERGGLAAARDLHREAPETRIVLLLSDDGLGYRLAASRVGARWMAKDRLVEGLPALLEAAGRTTEDWCVPEGEVRMDGTELGARFGGQPASASGVPLAHGWSRELLKAVKPAMVIFLVGAALLALTAFMAWDLRPPVTRDSAGGSVVVDDLGLFGQPGAVVELNRQQTDAYIAAELDHHRGSLLLCIAVGSIGLAVGSLLIAWLGIKEQRSACRDVRT